MSNLPVPKRERGQSKAHAHSRHQEKKAATKIGGLVTPGSGSKYQKGDARRRGLVRIECKATTKKSLRVDHAMLDKLEDAVFGSTEIPVIQVDLLREGRPVRTVYVVPDHAMDDLLERLTGDPAE